MGTIPAEPIHREKATKSTFLNLNFDFIQQLFPYIIFICTTGYFFEELLLGNKWLWSGYWSDLTEIYVPLMKVTIESFNNGHFPFWNPYAYGGAFHSSETTSLIFYPFFYFIYWLCDDQTNVISLLTNVLIIHFLIIQINFYLMSRHFGMSKFGAIFCSIAFTFSCSIVCRWQFLIIIFTVAWLPLLIIYFDKICNSIKFKLKETLIASLLVALSFLGGHPQYFFYNLLFLGIFFLVKIVLTQSKEKNFNLIQNLKKLGFLSIPILIGIAICAVQILPTIEAIPFTNRAAINFDFASDGSFQFKQFLSLLSPWTYGYYKGGFPIEAASYFATPGKIYHYWETACFFGVIPLILSVLGLVDRMTTITVKALIACMVFFLLYSFGSNFFLFKLLFQLPLFESFRIPSRGMLYVTFVLCLLSGFGMEVLYQKNLQKKHLIAVISAIAVVIIFGVAVSNTIDIPEEFIKSHSSQLSLYGLRIIAYSILTLISILVLRYFNINKLWIGSALLLLTFYDLCSYNKSYISCDTDINNSMNISPQLKDAISSNFTDLQRYRPSSNRERVITRNQASYHKIYSMDGFYGFILENKEPVPDNWPGSDLMSVSKETIRGDNGGIQLKTNSSAYKHARITYENIEKNPKEVIIGAVDLNKTTFVPPSDGLLMKWNAQQAYDNANHEIQVIDYFSDEINVRVKTDQAGMLVLAEKWLPMWKGYVDGKAEQVFKANYINRGIIVPEGDHIVTFKFESSYFDVGKWISLFSLFVIFVLLGQSPFTKFIKTK